MLLNPKADLHISVLIVSLFGHKVVLWEQLSQIFFQFSRRWNSLCSWNLTVRTALVNTLDLFSRFWKQLHSALEQFAQDIQQGVTLPRDAVLEAVAGAAAVVVVVVVWWSDCSTRSGFY